MLRRQPAFAKRVAVHHFADRALGEAADLVAGGRVDELVEERHDQPAFIAHRHRHVVIDRLALGLVKLAARRKQHLVELRPLEPRVVPVGVET